MHLETSELVSLQILQDLDDSSISACSNQVETEILNESTDDARSSTSAAHKIKNGSCRLFLFFSTFIKIFFVVNKTDEKHTEQAVKKAMNNILRSKSVIYTKTDLTQICNRPSIRLEAIARLIQAELLEHRDDLWIEPSRSKKNIKKDTRRSLREGWIK